MRLAHKRKVQKKLQKIMLAKASEAVATKSKAVVKADKAAPAKKAAAEATVETVSVSLTPKQQQVLDIVKKNPAGMSSKAVGVEAGQADDKAASWATGALKKLVESELLAKEQLDGNKVIYKLV